jgi:hypothetical protein
MPGIPYLLELFKITELNVEAVCAGMTLAVASSGRAEGNFLPRIGKKDLFKFHKAEGKRTRLPSSFSAVAGARSRPEARAASWNQGVLSGFGPILRVAPASRSSCKTDDGNRP